jgi:hypothetical protein
MMNSELLHGCTPLLSNKDCLLARSERPTATTANGHDNADLS